MQRIMKIIGDRERQTDMERESERERECVCRIS